MNIRSLSKWLWVFFLLALSSPTQAAPSDSAEEKLPVIHHSYLPLVMGVPPFEIEDIWVANEEDVPLNTYPPGTPLQYSVSGLNRHQTQPVALTWEQLSCWSRLRPMRAS